MVQGGGRARGFRALRRSVAALVLLGMLGGCESLVSQIIKTPWSDPSSGPSSGPPSGPPSGPSSNPAPKGPSPMDRPGAIVPAAPDGTQVQSQPDPEGAPPVTAALPPERQIDADPERLLGMAPEAVTELLGPPAFIRTDAPSLLWRYRGTQCLLDLFLYASAAADSPGTRVLHYAVQANGGSALSAEKCLQSLLLARMDKATG